MHSLGRFYYHDKKSNLKLSMFGREKTSQSLGKGKLDMEMPLPVAVVFAV